MNKTFELTKISKAKSEVSHCKHEIATAPLVLSAVLVSLPLAGSATQPACQLNYDSDCSNLTNPLTKQRETT